jgi:5-oxoprolinase (ATP-hydrolysing) subunit A
MTIDLNCDMGEGMLTDAAIIPFISSANIACGYHAGDEATIRATIALCQRHNVAIGAHPGFDDKASVGRLPVHLSSADLYRLVWEQLEIMNKICTEMEATLHHVKPHGALYNMTAVDAAMSRTLAQAVFDFNPQLVYYGLSGSVMIREAEAMGLKTANEVFADRTYQDDGTLTPRSQSNALIDVEEVALKQVLQILNEKSVTATNGRVIPLRANTICLHGDGPHALILAGAIHRQLLSMGFSITPIH